MNAQRPAGGRRGEVHRLRRLRRGLPEGPLLDPPGQPPALGRLPLARRRRRGARGLRGRLHRLRPLRRRRAGADHHAEQPAGRRLRPRSRDAGSRFSAARPAPSSGSTPRRGRRRGPPRARSSARVRSEPLPHEPVRALRRPLPPLRTEDVMSVLSLTRKLTERFQEKPRSFRFPGVRAADGRQHGGDPVRARVDRRRRRLPDHARRPRWASTGPRPPPPATSTSPAGR